MATAGEMLPEDLEQTLASFGQSLDNLDELLQPLISADFATLQSQLPPADKAQLLLALAYASNSLFWMYLNTSGIDPRQHPIKNELDRVKAYMKKLKDAVAKGNEEKNPQKLDKAAANRFIKAGLVDAGDELKEKLAEQVKKAEADVSEKKAKLKITKDIIADKIDSLAGDAQDKGSKSLQSTPANQKKRKSPEAASQTTGKKKKSKKA